MTSRRRQQQDKAAKEQIVAIRYTTSNLSRVVHGDGVWGGITPHGYINLAFFSERQAIPDQARMRVNVEKGIAEEIQDATTTISMRGVTRQIEVEVLVNINVAIALRGWLDNNIKMLQQNLVEPEIQPEG